MRKIVVGAQVEAPIENSPPGIHTLPAGAGVGAAAVLAIVGATPDPSATSADIGALDMCVENTMTAPATTARPITPKIIRRTRRSTASTERRLRRLPLSNLAGWRGAQDANCQ